MTKILTGNQQLKQALKSLIQIEPRFIPIYQLIPAPNYQKRSDGFQQLYKTIVSQQLSVAAADSIWHRLSQANLISQQQVLTADEATFKTMGLSKQKIRYVKSLASHNIDYRQLEKKDNETVIRCLTKVTGIGRWTAEIYCLFSLSRADIFPANDLALQAAAKEALQLKQRPTEKTLRQLSNSWSPYRSAAAYLLWDYYGYLKKSKNNT